MKYQRKEVIGNCTLYLANCHDIIHHLPRTIACVADPPYGVPIMVDMDFERKGKVKKAGRATEGKKFKEVIGNDEEFDPSPFIDGERDSNGVFSTGGFKELILWGANHYAHRLPHNGRWLLWDKRCGVIPERNQADCEMAWCNEYGAARMFRHIWDGMVRDSERGEKRVHPTQKPVALMEWCMKFIKADTVVDPFMGSGSTALACIRAGKNFIGIELDEEYFDAACARIRTAIDSPDLFKVDEKPVQQGFDL